MQTGRLKIKNQMKGNCWLEIQLISPELTSKAGQFVAIRLDYFIRKFPVKLSSMNALFFVAILFGKFIYVSCESSGSVRRYDRKLKQDQDNCGRTECSAFPTDEGT